MRRGRHNGNLHFRFKQVHLRIILLIGILIASIFLFVNLKIRNIICENQFGSCSKYITDVVNTKDKKNFYTSKRNVQKILDKNYLVEKYFIKYVPPDTLSIKLVERVADLSLKGSSSDLFFLVDDSGYVLGTSKETPLPVIEVGDKSFIIGNKVDDRVLFPIQLLTSIRNFSPFAKAVLEENQFIVEVDGKTKLLFPLEGNSDLISAKAYYVLSKYPVILDNGKKSGFDRIEAIDFRFKNPVIRYI